MKGYVDHRATFCNGRIICASKDDLLGGPEGSTLLCVDTKTPLHPLTVVLRQEPHRGETLTAHHMSTLLLFVFAYHLYKCHLDRERMPLRDRYERQLVNARRGYCTDRGTLSERQWLTFWSRESRLTWWASTRLRHFVDAYEALYENTYAW